MNQFNTLKQLVLWACGLILISPIVAYTGFLAWDVIVKTWKIGWGSQPLTFIGRSGIQAYIGYTVVVIAALTWTAWSFREKPVAYLALAACVMLALFALGFATSKLGVL